VNRVLPYLMTTCREKIYQTNTNTNTVTCYTIKGDKLWEYKDESLLKDPHGVTVDNYDNVYVTSCRSNSVVVLEPDGSQGRQILNSDDGLKDPTGLFVILVEMSIIHFSFLI
jgi:streptogramin lyase